MELIEANPGEMSYLFLQRVLKYCQDYHTNVEAKHNITTICVYQDSCVKDLYEKFDMQATINSCNLTYSG